VVATVRARRGGTRQGQVSSTSTAQFLASKLTSTGVSYAMCSVHTNNNSYCYKKAIQYI
jgi:hypothetical protein